MEVTETSSLEDTGGLPGLVSPVQAGEGTVSPSQMTASGEEIIVGQTVEPLAIAESGEAAGVARVCSPEAIVSGLEAQIQNVMLLKAPEGAHKTDTLQSEDVEMTCDDDVSMKSSDSIVTVASARKSGSQELAADDTESLQQPSPVRRALHSMEMLSTAVCASASATTSSDHSEAQFEVLANDFLEALESICGGLDSDRLRLALNRLCDKVKVNDKLATDAVGKPDMLQSIEGIAPIIQRTIYPKINLICEEIERLITEAGADATKAGATSTKPNTEETVGDQIQKLVDAVEETNQMKLRALKRPVDDDSISRQFAEINDSIVNLSETVKKVVSNAMTGSADLSLQTTAVQQALAAAVVTLTDLLSDDGLRDEAIKLLAVVNGGISRVSDAAEASAQALRSDDSPEMNLAIQALLEGVQKDIVAATNKFKEDLKDVTNAMREAAATSAEHGVQKFLMQGEAFDAETEDLSLAIEKLTAKKKRISADVKGMKKISGESANARASVDTILKTICSTVTGATKVDEDKALQDKQIQAKEHLERLGQKFEKCVALPQAAKELIAQKFKKAEASLAKLVKACVDNEELLRAAKDAKVKRRSLSPNQSKAIQDLENIRPCFDQNIQDMRLMLASPDPGEPIQKLFENFETTINALNKAEKSVLACAGVVPAKEKIVEPVERPVKKSASDSAVKQPEEMAAPSSPKSLCDASASLNASVTSLTEVVEVTAQMKLPSAASIENLTWSVCDTVQNFIAAVQSAGQMEVDQAQVQKLNDDLGQLTASVAETPSEACLTLDESCRAKVQKEISDVGISSAVLKQAVQNMTILIEESAEGGTPIAKVVKKQLANVAEAVEKLNSAVSACNRAVRKQMEEVTSKDSDALINERASSFREASVLLTELACSAVAANDKDSLGRLSNLGQTVKHETMTLMATMQRQPRAMPEAQAVRFVATVNEAVDSLLDTAEYALKAAEPDQATSDAVCAAVETITERGRAAEAAARRVAEVAATADAQAVLPDACEQLAQSFAALTSAIEDVVEARSDSPGSEIAPQRRVVAENCERVEGQLEALAESLISKPADSEEALDVISEQSEAFYLSLLELLVAVRARPTEDMTSQLMEACTQLRRQLEPLPSLLAAAKSHPTTGEITEKASKLKKVVMTLVAGSKKSLQLQPDIKDEILTSWVNDVTDALSEMLPVSSEQSSEFAMDTEAIHPSDGEAMDFDNSSDAIQKHKEAVDVFDKKEQDVSNFTDTALDASVAAEAAAEQSDSAKPHKQLSDLAIAEVKRVAAERSPEEDDSNLTTNAPGETEGDSAMKPIVEEAIGKLSKSVKAAIDGQSVEVGSATSGADALANILDNIESQINAQDAPNNAKSKQAVAELKEEITELGKLVHQKSLERTETYEAPAEDVIEGMTENLQHSLTSLASCVNEHSVDLSSLKDEMVAERATVVASIVNDLSKIIQDSEKSRKGTAEQSVKTTVTDAEATKEQVVIACDSLNESAENFTEALVDALSSQPSPGMLRSRADSVSDVISQLSAALGGVTDSDAVAPQLQQLNETMLQLAASVEGSSQTFDDATPLDNRVLEELVAPAIMEVSANIHTLRESVSSFTARLVEVPSELIPEVTQNHVGLVREAAENISRAVQEVGSAISSAVEKSRSEGYTSNEDESSSMLLDDVVQDLSGGSDGAAGQRASPGRRISDLEPLGDGKIDTENILNVMSAIGSLKLLQTLANDSETLTDEVGRVSAAVERMRSQSPVADETPAPTPHEVRAVCGTLHSSIEELTRSVRDMVSSSSASSGDVDSSLISKISDYRDTLLSVSAVTDNLVAGRPQLVEDGEGVRTRIDNLCVQADTILALTAEKSTIARSLQDVSEGGHTLDSNTNKKLQGICDIVSEALERPQTTEALGIEAALASEAPYLMEILLHPENLPRAKTLPVEGQEKKTVIVEGVEVLKDVADATHVCAKVEQLAVECKDEIPAETVSSVPEKENSAIKTKPDTDAKREQHHELETHSPTLQASDETSKSVGIPFSEELRTPEALKTSDKPEQTEIRSSPSVPEPPEDAIAPSHKIAVGKGTFEGKEEAIGDAVPQVPVPGVSDLATKETSYVESPAAQNSPELEALVPSESADVVESSLSEAATVEKLPAKSAEKKKPSPLAPVEAKESATEKSSDVQNTSIYEPPEAPSSTHTEPVEAKKSTGKQTAEVIASAIKKPEVVGELVAQKPSAGEDVTVEESAVVELALAEDTQSSKTLTPPCSTSLDAAAADSTPTLSPLASNSAEALDCAATLSDIVKRAVGGEIATIREAESAAEKLGKTLETMAQVIQESSHDLPGFRAQSSTIGKDLAQVTDALQDTIRSVRGTKMATKIQKDRIDIIGKPAAEKVRDSVAALVTSFQEMTDALSAPPWKEQDSACQAKAQAVSHRIQQLSDAISTSNSVRLAAVEQMKGLEAKMVVAEKAGEFGGALDGLLCAVERALVERGPGADAVVNLQAATSRHAAAKMVTAVTSVTGDRVLPERAQEVLEASLTAAARDAADVVTKMRGVVPCEDLAAVHPPLRHRLEQFQQLKEEALAVPATLAKVAEATPVPQFSDVFVDSVKDMTSATGTLTRVLRDIGEEHANATTVYHGREARRIIGEDLGALKKSTNEFFGMLVSSGASNSSPTKSWSSEVAVVSKAAEDVHTCINDLHLLEPSVREKAMPISSSDVMKNAVSVLSKCAKQLATLMDRVPEGKSVSSASGVGDVAKSADAVTEEMDIRLRVGTSENDVKIETTAEELQTMLASCVKKIRKELKLIDDELEMEEEERRAENKKKKMEETEQKAREAEEQRTKEEEDRKRKLSEKKEQMEIEEKLKEADDEKKLQAEAAKRKKRRKQDAEDKDAQNKPKEQISTADQNVPGPMVEGPGEPLSPSEDKQPLGADQTNTSKDAVEAKAASNVEAGTSAESKSGKEIQPTEAASLPIKPPGKLDSALIEERVILPPQDEIEGKRMKMTSEPATKPPDPNIVPDSPELHTDDAGTGELGEHSTLPISPSDLLTRSAKVEKSAVDQARVRGESNKRHTLSGDLGTSTLDNESDKAALDVAERRGSPDAETATEDMNTAKSASREQDDEPPVAEPISDVSTTKGAVTVKPVQEPLSASATRAIRDDKNHKAKKSGKPKEETTDKASDKGPPETNAAGQTTKRNEAPEVAPLQRKDEARHDHLETKIAETTEETSDTKNAEEKTTKGMRTSKKKTAPCDTEKAEPSRRLSKGEKPATKQLSEADGASNDKEAGLEDKPTLHSADLGSKDKKTKVDKSRDERDGTSRNERREAAMTCADGTEDIPLVMRTEDKLASAVKKSASKSDSSQDIEPIIGKRKKSLGKPREAKEAEPNAGSSAEIESSSEQHAVDSHLTKEKQKVSDETKKASRDTQKLEQKSQEARGFAAAPSDSGLTQQPGKLSEDDGKDAEKQLPSRKPHKGVKKELEEEPEPELLEEAKQQGKPVAVAADEVNIPKKEHTVKQDSVESHPSQEKPPTDAKSEDKESRPSSEKKKKRKSSKAPTGEDKSLGAAEDTKTAPPQSDKPAKLEKDERSVEGAPSGPTFEQSFPKRDDGGDLKSPEPAQRRRRESADHYAEHRRDPRKRPRWSTRLQDRTTIVGTRVKLTCACISEDDAPIEVDWYRNGAPLNPAADPRLRLSLSPEGVASVEISDVGHQDAGEYTCTARNVHGRASCTADLHVRGGAIEPRPSPPTFLTGLRVSYILEDDVLIIECQMTGHPLPKVTWLKDDCQMHKSSRFHQTVSEDGICKLLVKSPHEGDNGKYTCVAENRVHKDEISEQITVPERRSRRTPSPERADVGSAASRPVFLDALRDVEVREGQNLDLKVRVAAAGRGVTSPGRGVTSPGRGMTSPGRPWVTSAPERPSVTSQLERLARYPAPFHYHCPPAWRRLGLLRPRIVYVSRKHYRTGTWPGLAFSIPEYYPNRYIRARLRDIGTPVPDITWLYNGHSVRQSSAKLRAWGRFPDYTLSLYGLTASDLGTYCCRASNAHGSAGSSATVSFGVSGSRRPPRIIEKPEDMIRVASGGDLLLTTRITGEPRPKVTFHKGRHNLLASHRGTLETVGELHHLRLSGLHYSDSGTYCIEAQNCEGVDRCYVLIRVKDPNRAQTPDWDSRTSSRLMANAELRRTQRYTQDVPGPLPSLPFAKDVGQNWVSLGWPRPLYNGGAPILSYKVEAWLKCEDAMWDTVGMSVITSMDIFDLKPDRSYIFRVTPRNRFGWGEGSCSLPILIGRPRNAPRFSRPLPATTKCLLGESLVLECELEGEPRPEAVWLRDGIPLPAGLQRLQASQRQGRCQLTISGPRPSDQGTYTCHAANPAGEGSTFTRLTVVERELLLTADRAISSALESASSSEESAAALAPFFLLRPRERRVEAGSSVRLSCQVTGHPRPQVTWAKDGETLQQQDRLSMWQEAHDFYTLEITSAKFADVGSYSATAANEHGSITCSCMLVVDCGPLMYVAPELVRPLPEVTKVEANSTLELQARCTAYPAISVLWHREGKRVRMARRQALLLDGDGLATLRLSRVTHSDAGNFSCTMSNEMGSVATSTRVVVQDSPDGPVEAPCFLRDPASSHVLEGDSLTITCDVIGDPAPEVSWRREEAPPESGGLEAFDLVEDCTYCLRLSQVKVTDAGPYVVLASNRHGTAQHTMSLEVTSKDATVQGKQRKLNGTEPRPEFISGLRDLRCCDGDTATFQCQLRSASRPVVQWQKDGAVLPNSAEFKQTRCGDVLRLCVSQVHPDDQGQYTCVAFNDAGRAASRACLIVDVPEDSDLHVTSMLSSQEGPPPAGVPRHLSARTTPARLLSPRLSVPRTRAVSEQPTSYLLGSGSSAGRARRRLEAPRFYAAPHDRTAEEGENVTLKCSVSGQPNPVAVWDRENITIRNSDKYRVTEAGDERLLLIRNVKKSDAGLYRVTLQNDAGRMQATARLCVIGKPRPLSPLGVPSLERPGSGLGGSRMSRSRADSSGRGGVGDILSHPASGVWFCDVELVPGGQPIRLGDGGALVEDNASSPVDEVAPPEFVYPLRDVTVAEGQQVRLDVTVTGSQPLEVTWVKNNVTIRDCADFRHVAMAGGHFALVIDDIYPADEGFYFCEVSNAHGQAVSHGHVTVTEDGVADGPATSESSPIREVSAPAGATVRLWVRSTGVATVDWTLNGQHVRHLDTEHTKVSRTSEGHALELLRLTAEHAGTVAVNVRGPAGCWHSQVALRVTPDTGGSSAPAP
ncbi:titin homolog, partial [Pollicipes pollicipes]|uniref:titin homolog n=1 Tax=Pollicipes pollicipes TaxID=41117 RepID=UPI001885964A